MVKEIVVPFADLRMVSVECGNCQTLMVVNLEKEPHVVTFCPACRTEFDPGVKEALPQLSRLYFYAQTAKHKLAFRSQQLERKVRLSGAGARGR